MRFAKRWFLIQFGAYLCWVVSQTFLVWLHCDKVRRGAVVVVVVGLGAGAARLDGLHGVGPAGPCGGRFARVRASWRGPHPPERACNRLQSPGHG